MRVWGVDCFLDVVCVVCLGAFSDFGGVLMFLCVAASGVDWFLDCCGIVWFLYAEVFVFGFWFGVGVGWIGARFSGVYGLRIWLCVDVCIYGCM